MIERQALTSCTFGTNDGLIALKKVQSPRPVVLQEIRMSG